MALQVWLPLDGDLKNLGLDRSKIPSLMGSGITYTEGKIGLAATFPNNCNSCIHMPGLRLQTGSFAAWLKVNGAGGSSRLCLISEGRDSYNDGVEIYTSQAGTTLYFKAHEKILSTIIELNKWYHIVGTFGNLKIQLFLNGELKSSNTYTTDMTYQYASDLTLGKMSYSYNSTSNYFAFNGKLNDVRIYDHALSLKEIKELAKGLILHYKLDKPMPNLLNGNSHLSSAWVGDNATVTNSSDNSIKIISSAANGRIYNSLSNVWTSGKKYTVSFEAKSDTTGTTIDASRSINANNFTQVFSLTTSWLHYVGIINCNATATGGTLSIRINLNNRTVYLRSIKLEEGEKETGYIPPINSNLYSAMGYNSNIEPDCSGYKRDGIITGTLIAVADTPRYKTCNNITNNSSYIKIDNLLTSGFSNSYSFSWWGKISSFSGRMFWGFSNGIRLNGVYNGNLWNTGDSSNNPLYVPGTTTLITVPSVNIWHHFVMTGDGTNCKLYLDGKYYGIAKTYKSISGTTIYINGWDSGTSYSGQIYISDFRIYCTALSETDVKALYNDSASIDKNGNFHAYEYVEDGNRVDINKQGVFTVPEEIMENSLREPSIDNENIYAKGEFYED